MITSYDQHTTTRHNAGKWCIAVIQNIVTRHTNNFDRFIPVPIEHPILYKNIFINLKQGKNIRILYKIKKFCLEGIFLLIKYFNNVNFNTKIECKSFEENIYTIRVQ